MRSPWSIRRPAIWARWIHDHPAADGRKTFLDFRETAPKGATANMYLDKDGNVIKACPPRAPRRRRAAAFPAWNTPGRIRHHEARGSDRAGLQLAEDGFALDQATSTCCSRRPRISGGSCVSRHLLNNGKPFQVGEKLVQHELARPCAKSASGAPTASTRAGRHAIVASSQAGKA